MSGRFDSDDACDGLTTMVLAIHEDPRLSSWFQGLESLSSVERRNEVFRMRAQLMSSNLRGVHDVATALALLANDQIFGAARAAFQSL